MHDLTEYVVLKYMSICTMSSLNGVGSAVRSRCSTPVVTSAVWVTSSGTIVSATPDSNTRRAASGSVCQGSTCSLALAWRRLQQCWMPLLLWQYPGYYIQSQTCLYVELLYRASVAHSKTSAHDNYINHCEHLQS